MGESEKRVSRAGASSLGQEPAILSYFGLLWRRRFLILFGSLIPALAVGAILHFWPPQYTATFVYERPLTESQYSVLLRRFYSSENLGKIAERLRDRGLAVYAQQLVDSEAEQSLERLIRFRVFPEYPKRLLTTDPATSELISNFQAQLLYIDITTGARETVATAAEVITDNIESVLPIYDIRNDLLDLMRQFKTEAAKIEENRFSLTLDLQQEKARLEQLMSLGNVASQAGEADLTLQFTDVSGSREFLPLPYQQRAVQSKIIDVNETLNSDEQKYAYYVRVLKLNHELLDTIEKGILTYYTVKEYFDFLGDKLLKYQGEKDSPVGDYLKSYIRKTQNLVLVNTRAGENPMVYPVSRRPISRAVLTLVVFLMVTAFAAIVLEFRSEQRRGGRS